jgi:hypothetical protein
MAVFLRRVSLFRKDSGSILFEQAYVASGM